MPALTIEDQNLLRDSARRFFTEQMPVSQLRELRDSRDPHGYRRDLWDGMAGMGWLGILIAEEHGGVDFGYENLGIILEESGRTLAASPLVSTALLGASLLNNANGPHLNSAYLRDICAGELIVTLAIDEQARHQPNDIETQATSSVNGFKLDGSKTFVLDGHIADRILVLARTAGARNDINGLSVFDIDPTAPGVSIQRNHLVDGRNAATIELDNVLVTADHLVGDRDGAYPIVERCLDAARAGLAAEMLGSMSEAFERTLAYLRIRTQFDVPIGSFQALKHRAALMYCEIELTRSAVYAALAALDQTREGGNSYGQNRHEPALLASLAKAKASETFELVSNEAVQMHGGIGMTDAEEIGLFLKRARVAQQTFGDALFHQDRYATLNGF